jgi:MFS family permease
MTVDAAARSGVVRAVRALPRHGRLLIVGVAINRMASFLQVFLVLYLISRGERPEVAGIALAAFGAGAVLGVTFGGWLADRVGCRLAVVISMTAAGAGIAVVPFTSGSVPVIGLALLVGGATQVFRPAALTLLAESTPSERMVLVTAGYRFGLNVGAMLMPLLGALLLRWSYEVLFVVDAATSLAFAAIALLALPDDRPPRRAAEGSEVVGRPAATSPLRDGRFVLFVLGLFLISLVEVQYMATLPLEVLDRGLSSTVYAGLVALNGLLVIAVEPALTGLLQGWPTRRAIALGVMVIGLGIATYGLPGGLGVLIAATLVWTFGEMVGAPPASAYPALASSPTDRARYLAAAAGSQGAGYALGPIAGTALYGISPAALWTACAVIGVAAALVCRAGTHPGRGRRGRHRSRERATWRGDHPGSGGRGAARGLGRAASR